MVGLGAPLAFYEATLIVSVALFGAFQAAQAA